MARHIPRRLCTGRHLSRLHSCRRLPGQARKLRSPRTSPCRQFTRTPRGPILNARRVCESAGNVTPGRRSKRPPLPGFVVTRTIDRGWSQCTGRGRRRADGRRKNDTERAGGQHGRCRFRSAVPMVMGCAEPWGAEEADRWRPSGRRREHAGIRSMSAPGAAAPSLRCAPGPHPRRAGHADRPATTGQGPMGRMAWSAWPRESGAGTTETTRSGRSRSMTGGSHLPDRGR